MRGSPHAHCLLWVKDAPNVTKDPDDVVCASIDVTHMKFRVVSGIFTVLSYIGQCDLHNLFWVTMSMVYPWRWHV